MVPQYAHNWVVEFQSQNRGHRDTRLCPYFVLNSLYYIPCLQFLTVVYSHDASSPPLSSSPSSAASARSLESARSSPSCSHNLQENQAPGLCTYLLHSSIIGRVAIYCAAAFCLFRMYTPISLKPASFTRGGCSQPPFYRFLGCLLVIRRVTLS